jgi:acetyl esterase/lipase
MAITGLNPDWFEYPKKGSNPITKIDHIKRRFLDLPYAQDSDLQKLDIYLPDEVKDKYPVIFNIHGGGFSVCDKRDFHLYPNLFGLQQGFAIVSINYRLSPAVRFPEHYFDVMRALKWLSQHGQEYSLDTNNVFLWGTSAGGTLVLLAGQDVILPLPFNYDPQNLRLGAVAAFCPGLDYMDLGNKKINFEQLLLKFMMSTTRKGIFGSNKPTQAQLDQINPLTYLKKGFPPLYIMHGDADPAIPYHQAENLYKHMKPLLPEKDLVLHPLLGGVHAGAKAEFFVIENVQPVLDFFKARVV